MLKAIITAMVFLVSFFPGAATAEESNYEITEDILFVDLSVSVASKAAQKESEAPAVLTVITREEIQNSGARELGDILSMVPGFTLGKEIIGVKGYGIAGLWSLEGKMLVMIDGVQMNEILYGNPVFGGSCFVDYIDHIEIIRGPGSALYGGFAELAVVNIITRNANTPGTSVSMMYGQMGGAYGHRSLNASCAGETNGVKVSANAAVGDGHSSDRDFTDQAGQTFSLKDFSEKDAWFADLGLEYKDLLLKVIANSYVIHSVSQGIFDSTLNLYGPNAGIPLEKKFDTYAFDSQYKIRLNDNFFITPRATYIDANPWYMDDTTNPTLYYNYYVVIHTRQAKLSASAEYDFDQKTSLVLGGEYSEDSAHSNTLTGPLNNNGSNDVTLITRSVFGEFMTKADIANFTVGARYDQQNQFGGAFAPRLAITKTVGDFHLKGLISRAYHTPTIQNINRNPDIKPEFTNTVQAEATYMINKNKSVTLDVFDTRIEDVIVFDANTGKYNNFDKTGTQGFDLGYKMSEQWGYLNLSYSYYKVIDNGVPIYVARNPDGSVNNNVLLGFPADKASLSASYNIRKNVSVNPSILYLGQRYITYWMNSAGGEVNQVIDPVTVVNVNIRAKQLAKNIEIDLGVFNMFDTSYLIAPGYAQDELPVSSYSREYTVKLTYNF